MEGSVTMVTTLLTYKMSSPRMFKIVFSFQILFIIIDAVINVAAPLIKGHKLLITFLFM